MKKSGDTPEMKAKREAGERRLSERAHSTMLEKLGEVLKENVLLAEAINNAFDAVGDAVQTPQAHRPRGT